MRFLGGLGLLSLTLFLVACDKSSDSEFQERDPNAKFEFVETIEEGTGPEVDPGNVAYVLYRGTFKTEATEQTPSQEVQFDTNMDDLTTQTPWQVRVVKEDQRGGMIEGFDQAVAQMKVGDHKKVSIPWEQGYGERGNPPKIPPFQDLFFEIKILYVFKPEESEVFDIPEDVPGTGTAAKSGDTVEIHYKGTYLTGKVWDDTRERGKTVQFTLGDKTAVIPGINAGMGGLPNVGVEPMKVGGKRTIIIPHTLAYGTAGSQYIQGNQPLKIEIELVSVNGNK